MAFTTGTATFTQNSTLVTNVVTSSGELTWFASGTEISTAGNLPVECTKLESANSFRLRNNWSHPTGTYEFSATQTAEGLRDAVAAFNNEAETLKSISGGITQSNTDTTIGRIVKVGDVGTSRGVANASTFTGDVRNIIYDGAVRVAGSATNLPVAQNGYIECLYRTGAYKMLRFTTDTGDVYIQTENNGSWGSWDKLTNDSELGASAYLESYKNYGLGLTADSSPVSDLNTISETSIRRYNNNTANIPNAESAYGTVITMCRSSAEATQLAVDLYGTVVSRGKSSSIWGAWRKQLDSLNTNLNEFGGLGNSDLICPTIGFSENGGVVSFLLPISSKTTPTSITVSGGFRLFNVEVGTYENAPQTPTLNAALSSTKAAYISFSGTSSASRGKLYLLASSTSSIGKIIVNY